MNYAEIAAKIEEWINFISNAPPLYTRHRLSILMPEMQQFATKFYKMDKDPNLSPSEYRRLATEIDDVIQRLYCREDANDVHHTERARLSLVAGRLREKVDAPYVRVVTTPDTPNDKERRWEVPYNNFYVAGRGKLMTNTSDKERTYSQAEIGRMNAQSFLRESARVKKVHMKYRTDSELARELEKVYKDVSGPPYSVDSINRAKETLEAAVAALYERAKESESLYAPEDMGTINQETLDRAEQTAAPEEETAEQPEYHYPTSEEMNNAFKQMLADLTPPSETEEAEHIRQVLEDAATPLTQWAAEVTERLHEWAINCANAVDDFVTASFPKEPEGVISFDVALGQELIARVTGGSVTLASEHTQITLDEKQLGLLFKEIRTSGHMVRFFPTID